MTIKKFTLPKPIAYPLSLLPDGIHSKLLVIGLNRVFSRLIRTGELDFLENRTVCIRIKDANVAYRIRLTLGLFNGCGKDTLPDVTISANCHDFLSLALRDEDSDTLFFQRRLCLEGDTELGLQLKNVLDAVEIEDLNFPAPVQQALKRAGTWVERLAS